MRKTLVYTFVVTMPPDQVEGLEEILQVAQGYGSARVLDVALVKQEFDAVSEDEAMRIAHESLAEARGG